MDAGKYQLLLPSISVRAKTMAKANYGGRILQRSIELSEKQRLSDAEELANAISHGCGCVLAILASSYIVTTHGFPSKFSQLGFVVYACSLVLVLLASTGSHIAREPQRLKRWRAWDQGAIYLLIAGTYTPGIIAFCAGWSKGIALLLVWGLAAFGFYSKVFAEHRLSGVATMNYLALGWLPAMILCPQVSRAFFLWLLAGGVGYSAGVWFLVNDGRVRFFHLVWHLWVIFAAGIHFYAISTTAI